MNLEGRVASLERQLASQIGRCRCGGRLIHADEQTIAPDRLRDMPFEELSRMYRVSLNAGSVNKCQRCGAKVAQAKRNDPEDRDRLQRLPLDELKRLHQEAFGLLPGVECS